MENTALDKVLSLKLEVQGFIHQHFLRQDFFRGAKQTSIGKLLASVGVLVVSELELEGPAGSFDDGQGADVRSLLGLHLLDKNSTLP